MTRAHMAAMVVDEEATSWELRNWMNINTSSLGLESLMDRMIIFLALLRRERLQIQSKFHFEKQLQFSILCLI